MFDRIQNIGNVIGDNNIFVNGDAVVGQEVLTKVAEHLLRLEFDRLTKEARSLMQTEVNECVKQILEEMCRKHIVSEFGKFSSPATQFALYATLKGYAITETVEHREMLVDAFVERIQTEWDSSEKMIIDSALDVLPNLSPQTLSTLGLLQIRHQMINPQSGFMMDMFFKNLTPLVEKMAKLNVLDMEYMKQQGLILPLPGLQCFEPIERYLLKQYDLFFRHPLANGVYDDYCKVHPEARYAISDKPYATCMMWIDGMHNNENHFCFTNSQLFVKHLEKRHQEYMIPHFEALREKMPPFLEDEVRRYLINLCPAWEKIILLFSSKTFTQYTLSITGNYIGGKILAKACHNKALSLADYNNTFMV